MNKTILTDVDGVLLDYEQGFSEWMLQEHNHKFNPNAAHSYSISERYNVSDSAAFDLIRQFNESQHWLTPLRDAESVVKTLHDKEGYKFIAITSFGTEPSSVQHREEMLNQHFGSVFSDIICLPLAAGKGPTLRKWLNSQLYWIEDFPKNASAGARLGLRSILMRHAYNQHFDGAHENIHTADDWGSIANIIKGNK